MSCWRQQLSTQMDTNKSDEDIDDALITDSVKKLLSDSDGSNFDLAADLLSANNSSSGNAMSQMHSSGATVQEGMDLVDALDTLVQHLSRESNNNNNKELIDSNVDPNNLLLTAFDVVLMDHNYCQPVFVRPVTGINTTQSLDMNKQSFETSNKQFVNSVQSSVPLANVSSPSTTSSTTPSSPTTNAVSPAAKSPKTPTASRRSQRQIDKIEKSVLEKIKAENQEMLKREKESMESPNKIKPEPIEDNKDGDENELVIDFENKKEKTINSNKKRPKKTKFQSDEPTNKKPRMENKQEIRESRAKVETIAKESHDKHESSELDDVIAALSGVTDSEDKTPSSGRSQRTRRKPKRWDDDEVEVDFSGQLGILAQEQQLKEDKDIKVDNKEEKQQIVDNKINRDDINNEKNVKGNESQPSSDEANDDDEEDSGSDFGSEDDPDKLWCICRQPHDDRFMIGCDSCEEWFHGKCVNVTKLQGRQMEKAKQEWLCPTCTKGISDGMTREELKRIADQKRSKLEEEERIRAQTKRAAKDKFLKREKSREMSKMKEKKEVEKKKEQKPEKLKILPKTLQMPPKKRELNIKVEEEEKLKKLIKSSKKDLNKKRELMSKKLNKESDTNKSTKSPLFEKFEPISKVVPIIRKPEVKKKHKDAIDPSVQDLFKAEPIKKTSVTTPTTPTTPVTPGGIPFHRKSSDSRRVSTSTVIERLCPSGCGKMVKSDTSIYCNQDCIEVHVNETLKLLRIARKEKGETGAKSKDIDRRVVVVEKSSGRLLSGKDGILEKDVLEYIKSNPTFEVFRPSNVKDKKKDETHSKNALFSPTKATSPKKDDKKTPIARSNSRSGEHEGSDPIRANVRTSLKETLISRCKEVNETSVQPEEIRKIANRIEEELFKVFNKDTSGKYRNKYRSLIFNLKDAKNQGLFRKVVNGKISPERLVQMSAEELASSELAKWREREKTSMLEMIKRDAAEKVNQVIVKKTHKGEELIESAVVSETTNEPKSVDGKSSVPASAPNTGVSTILDDLMGISTVDTTSQHRTHLFSNNCRICTKQQLPDDNKQEVVKKPSSQSSSTQREEHSRPTPKRVRVELETANKILEEAAKLSSTAKAPFIGEDDDSAEAPSSTVCLSSPEAPSSSSSSRPVWKGTVFMQDVAKFAANAIKVSGAVTEFLPQDVSEQITVCGRIAPEQVLDYVKKLKYSSRTEIGIIKFVSSREERVGYDAFFNYLDSRGRYGVVGSTGKLLKDFYILPLPKNGDVPEVLLPFDGPGLDKKSMRPNLLLGILIRSKKPITPQTPQTSSSASSQNKSKTSNPSSNPTDRSYTPPPKDPSSQSSPDDNKDLGDVSYTPPRITSKTTITKPTTKKVVNDDDEPYDPEEAELSNSNSLPSSTSSIQELMDQVAKSSNPVEMTSSVLSAIASSSNYELQRRLLDQLTAKVEEQKRQLEEQKLEAEAHFASNNSSNTSLVIPGLDGQFGSLKDINIPDNLQDILSSVRQKTHEIEQQQERLKAVAASGFKFDDPIVKKFGSRNATEDMDQTVERCSEAEPMDLDDDVTPTKSSIIEVNAPLNNANAEATTGPQTSDPRLRSKKQTPLPSISQETGSDSQVAAMTADELMQKAREQMAALAKMEKAKDKPMASKIKIEWKKKK